MKELKVLILTISLLQLVSCSRSCEVIFNAIFEEYDLEEVEIINCQDQYAFDCCIWLHFKILEKDTLKLHSDYEESTVRFKRWGNPPGDVNWWKPEELGKGAKYYEKKSIDGQMIEGIYIKATEVYYVNRIN